MKPIFNKPVLEQLFDFRKEEFDQDVYDNNNEIREIEQEVCELSEGFIKHLKSVISNEEDLNKALKLFRNYESKSSEESDCWELIYYKLGVTEGNKIANEVSRKNKEIQDNNTFLNYENNNFSEWLEGQKRKYIFETSSYKELQNRYRKISEKYPNAIEVFEDFKPMALNKEEIEALIELRMIDLEMADMEKDLCFKLGVKEVLNF